MEKNDLADFYGWQVARKRAALAVLPAGNAHIEVLEAEILELEGRIVWAKANNHA
jgi:hypothetical protein